MVVKYIFFFDFLYQVQSGTITKYQPDFRPGSSITGSSDFKLIHLRSFLMPWLRSDEKQKFRCLQVNSNSPFWCWEYVGKNIFLMLGRKSGQKKDPNWVKVRVEKNSLWEGWDCPYIPLLFRSFRRWYYHSWTSSFVVNLTDLILSWHSERTSSRRSDQ